VNKYWDKVQELSKEFSAFDFEKRKEMCRYLTMQQLTTIEQIKIDLKRNYQRLIRELSDWENNILISLAREEREQALADSNRGEGE